MTEQEFNQFCSTLPATSYVNQWGGAHVWKVGGKVFAIGGWQHNAGSLAFTFKTSQLNYYLLSVQPGYRPAPYLASRGMTWIQLYDVSETGEDELKDHLRDSHRLVSRGLTKRRQKELGLNQDEFSGDGSCA
ncbi:MmcQ/YjbR family DNA-binding protein [Synechococcus sp. CS-205]|uniref:MmcQ/YjbR family DNA-binding protein n=1 Tax=Synechococcus sp. CS-205 TaxID=2847984 RepID=UPI00223B69C6|nr:MmcQ/YjbR family DNA-binding protein [Synechococcus sp. CS-205]MCT0249556.1 MmcQ/YjbR family DNA-binding protein [Synechococcus sp. CS-205]